MLNFEIEVSLAGISRPTHSPVRPLTKQPERRPRTLTTQAKIPTAILIAMKLDGIANHLSQLAFAIFMVHAHERKLI